MRDGNPGGEDTLGAQGASPHPGKTQAGSTEPCHRVGKGTDQQMFLRGNAKTIKSQAKVASWWKDETCQLWVWPQNKMDALPSFSVRA